MVTQRYKEVRWDEIAVTKKGGRFSNAVYTGYKNARIYLYGYNYDRLHHYAQRLKENVSGHERVKDPEITGGSRRRSSGTRHKVVVDLNREYLARMDFPPRQIYRSLKRKTHQPENIGSFFIGGQRQQLNLESSTSQFDRWDLSNMPLDSGRKMTRLNMAGQVNRKKTGTDIYKNNQEYQLAVAFDFVGPNPLKKKVMERFVQEANVGLPLGYRAEQASYSYWREEGSKAWMLGLIILIIFFICSILFESLRQPFVILSLVPVSFMGVFLTFYLFNINFDQGGFASFILLAGITVNAGLYIINEYNNVSQLGGSHLRRYLKAFNHKIIPILLTISSTILGLVPFLIGGQNEAFWFAFAAGSIGGLIFSLVGLLVFLPAFFVRK